MYNKAHVFVNEENGIISIEIDNNVCYELPAYKCSTKEKAERELHTILITEWCTEKTLEDVARAISLIWRINPDIPF